ncbi:branched-chain amino acid ABC transporter substrate-binding protein [Phreatobacter sp. AB_2022a]|uniref:branched-chain amino acid ABC transporter substrate-binding protein n=1 Tax=Phreatobacter sp. AB_2022a TaxID=3003134 RepID=UPI0022875D08|nr:branched-chain amino acid ABC transporter substrate-binding protein [Phreatobacter sp. AB_2022a]MCZ0735736.1 branched-chain amino acid ABC transporter substrate-binding protein [Phreatobacter sp. AB_2022a]
MSHVTRRQVVGSGLAAAALSSLPASAQSGPVRIAFIDPLSGFMAPVGDGGLKQFEFEAERINAAGGVAGGRKLEVVGFDNKLNPQEAIVQLEKAIDQGIRFVSQGNGSSVASALIDAIEKHNARNPRQSVMYLNYAAVEPIFTNDKCSFWHFRFDADSDMKMSALTDYIKGQPDLKRIYIIGQDYSFGKALAESAVKMLAAKRPDIQIVGNELHPLARVRDFSPYITKIRSAGAQAVITGNWGNDMQLLIKASSDAGFNVPYFTYYGGGLGAVAGIGRGGVGLVRQVTEWHSNIPDIGMDDIVRAFKAKHRNLDYYYYRVKVMFDMLAKAMNDTKSAEPREVALALEGMDIPIETGRAQMRKDNHQLIQPLFISTLSDNVRFDIDNTGFGFKTDVKIEGQATAMPTTCQMRRPGA